MKTHSHPNPAAQASGLRKALAAICGLLLVASVSASQYTITYTGTVLNGGAPLAPSSAAFPTRASPGSAMPQASRSTAPWARPTVRIRSSVSVVATRPARSIRYAAAH